MEHVVDLHEVGLVPHDLGEGSPLDTVLHTEGSAATLPSQRLSEVTMIRQLAVRSVPLALLIVLAACATNGGQQVSSSGTTTTVGTSTSTGTPNGSAANVSDDDFCQDFKAAKDASDAEMLQIASTAGSVARTGTLPAKPRGALQLRTELASKLAAISPPELRDDLETLYQHRQQNQQRIESGNLDSPMIEDGDALMARIATWLKDHCGITLTTFEF